MQVAGIAALVESVEEPFGLVLIESDTIVTDFDDNLIVFFHQFHIDFSTVEGVFEGIGKQVGNHFIKVHTVHPRQDFGLLGGSVYGHRMTVYRFAGSESIVDVALLRIVFI